MIAVAGFNTAIDRLIDVDTLSPGVAMHARDAQAWPGGKGAHAALCAATLGEPVRLTGFVDRTNREGFTEWLRQRGVEFDAVEMSGAVRTCFAIRDREGRTTEILEPGPEIDEATARRAIDTFVAACSGVHLAVLSGSVPLGMTPSTYRDIVARLEGVRVIVDASGDLLSHVLEAHPFCVKPNRSEAEALTGIPLTSPEAASRAAREIQSRGVRLVVISLGADGVVASWGSHLCHLRPPEVTSVNPVGAGDCLAGGLAAALARESRDSTRCNTGVVDALKLGVAAGTAKVLTAETGLVRRDDIDAMLGAIDVRWL